MPALIPVIVGSVLQYAGASAFTIFLATSAANMLVGGYERKRQQRAMRQQFNAAQVDRLASVESSVAPRELVLGRVRKGGNVFFRASTGTNKSKAVVVQEMAYHQCDAIETIYLNDVAVSLDGDGYVLTEPYASTRKVSAMVDMLTDSVVLPHTPIADSVSVSTPGTNPVNDPGGVVPHSLSGTTVTTSGMNGIAKQVHYQYEETVSKARIRWYLGTSAQTADARLIELFPDQWTSAHRARGVCYIIGEFDYDETAFPTGLPVITATMRGALVYDPRTATTAWSENPALLQRHVYSHARFGNKTVSADLDERITAAANICDTETDYVVDGQTVTRALYTASLVVPFGTPTRDVLDDLAQAMAGQWAYAQGELHVRAGAYTAPVMTLTDQDLADVVYQNDQDTPNYAPLVIRPHTARVDKFNTVPIRIWDEDQDYKESPLPPLSSSALITADGGALEHPELVMPAVSFSGQALHVAGIMMREARDPLTVTLSFKLRAYPLEIFDTVALTISRYGWSAKEFMVVRRQWTLTGLIQLTLKEITATNWDMDAGFSVAGYASNTDLPRPWEIDPPSGLVLAAGTNELLQQADGTILTRVRVSWDAITDVSLTQAGQVELQYMEVGTDQWLSHVVDAASTETFLTGVRDGSVIVVRARTRNRLAVSVWGVQKTIAVAGKTEPPDNYDLFTIDIQPDGTRQFNFAYTTTDRPIDLAGAVIRYVEGLITSPAWASMKPLGGLNDDDQDPGFYTKSPAETNLLLAGDYTFALAARDTTGNVSEFPVYLQAALPDRRLGNVIEEYAEHSEGWTGTLSSCVIIDGVIEASNGDTWADLSTWAAWTRWNSDPASPIVYTGPVRDLGVQIAGSINSAIDADGTVVQELRTSNDNVTWSSWGSADASFTARYVQLRATVTATVGDPVPGIRTWRYSVNAALQREYLNDVDVSTLTGSYRIGTGDVRIPLVGSPAVVRRVSVAIQDSSAATWTWVLIDKSTSPSPRIQFRKGGTLTDPALVDFYVEYN